MEYEQKVRKKVWEIFGNSKKVTTFALAIEREIIDAKDGPFVYRLGRKIFILERGGPGTARPPSRRGSTYFSIPVIRGRTSEIAGI